MGVRVRSYLKVFSNNAALSQRFDVNGDELERNALQLSSRHGGLPGSGDLLEDLGQRLRSGAASLGYVNKKRQLIAGRFITAESARSSGACIQYGVENVSLRPAV